MNPLKSFVFALFLLFPIDTVIFEERSSFRQSSSGGCWNRTRDEGLSFPASS